MLDAVIESPLAGVMRQGAKRLLVDGRECLLAEVPVMDIWTLRGDAGDARFVDAVLQATGMHLPLKANTVSIDPQRQLLWMGPDEWLLKTSDGQGDATGAALRPALQGLHSAVVEVGHGNTTLSVKGVGAAELLARGCPLDLHVRAFPTGSLAQSHVAKANVTLLCLQAGTHYELTVRRSFADYLFHWLSAAGD